MKKILVLLFISFASFAQTEKGMFTAGNNLFSTFRSSRSSYKYFELSPSIGKLIKNNLEIGGTLYLGSEIPKFGGRTLTRFGVLADFKKYFGRKKMQPFIYIGAGPMMDSFSNLNLGINSSVGIQYFLAENISVGLYGVASDLAIGGLYTSIGSSFSFYFLPKSKPLKTIDL